MTWHQSDIRSSARFGDLVWAVARDGNADRQRANNHAATDGLTSPSGGGMAQRVLGASRDVLLESLMCPLVLHASSFVGYCVCRSMILNTRSMYPGIVG